MATLMLVNPRKRRRKAKSNPHKRRKAKKNPIFNFSKPAKHRRRKHRKHHARRFKRNPISLNRTVGSFTSAVPQILKPAALAAVGAVSLDLLWGYLPLPVTIKTGVYAHIAKAAGAVALGVFGAKVLGRDTAMKFATGAMTVVLYGVLRDFVSKQFPAVKLGAYPYYGAELGYISSGQQAGLGMYDYPAGVDMNALPMPVPGVGSSAIDEPSGLGIYD